MAALQPRAAAAAAHTAAAGRGRSASVVVAAAATPSDNKNLRPSSPPPRKMKFTMNSPPSLSTPSPSSSSAIPAVAAPFEAWTTGSAIKKRTDIKSIMILGAGPIVIGQVRLALRRGKRERASEGKPPTTFGLALGALKIERKKKKTFSLAL